MTRAGNVGAGLTGWTAIRRSGSCAAALGITLAVAAGAQAQERSRPTLNFYGVTGLIDMPSAESQPNGQISTTISNFGGITRTTLAFQIAPRLSGAFRYSAIQDWNSGGFATYYDRGFDLRLRAIDEGQWASWVPAVTIGLQDFAGTGLYSGEYIVATKHLTDQLKITAGLGWGRLGSSGAFGNTGTRPPIDIGEGGNPNTSQWFRGPVAPFGGIEWQPTDRLTLKAEYSSDAYTLESDERGVFDRNSSFNFGATYEVADGFAIGAYSMYGSELGVFAKLSFNPNDPPNPGSIEPAPAPVAVRVRRADDPGAWSTAWTQEANADAIIAADIETWLAREGMALEAFEVNATEATLWLQNDRYNVAAQAIGRAARILTRTLPASVEVFHIIPVHRGLPISRITLQRSDVEELANALNGGAQIVERAVFSDPGPRPAWSAYADGRYSKFHWGLEPDLELSFFDPEQPVRGDLDLRLWGRYEALPGLVLNGAVAGRIVGNLDQIDRTSNSELPRVRSDFALYAKEGDPGLSELTAAYFFKPGRNLYGRATVGYLEPMFGGVSTELLWKPVESRLALGAELNYAVQRDYDMQLGFQDYDVVTGHLTAYYGFGNGYEAQIAAGRYLAGDWGTTVAFRRTFRNGWQLGAFATFTDVSAEQFGEGSFDKGIELTVPLSWFIGQPSRRKSRTVLRSLARDGGQPLIVADRLYPLVRDYQEYWIDDTSARFWR
jgi:hypothetical protein